MKIFVHDQEDFDLIIRTSKELHDTIWSEKNGKWPFRKKVFCGLNSDNPVINGLMHLYRINSKDVTKEEIKAIKKILVIDKSVHKIQM